MRCAALLAILGPFLFANMGRAGDNCHIPCHAEKPASCCAMECVYSCRPVVKKAPIEKECFEIKSEYICVPPVQFPRWCRLFGCGNCCDSATDAACADVTSMAGAGGLQFPWQRSERSSHCSDRIRKVRKLSKKEYECGEKCVVEWKLECVCRPISCTPASVCLSERAPQACAPSTGER